MQSSSWRCLLSISLLLCGGQASGAPPFSAHEYEIKAAYLFNLGLYIQWPEHSFASAADPFRFCILGQDPFGDNLNVVIANRTIESHPVEIVQLDTSAAVGGCKVLFISASEQTRLPEVLRQVQDLALLSVSDMSNFIDQGGMLSFVRRGSKIRLELNPSALRQAGLKPSAHLLNLSERREPDAPSSRLPPR